MPDPSSLELNLRGYLERLTERAEAVQPRVAAPTARSARPRRVTQEVLVLIACTAVFAAVLGAGLAIRLGSSHQPVTPAPSAPQPATAAPVPSGSPTAPPSPSASAQGACRTIAAPAGPSRGPLPATRAEAAMATDPRDCSILLFGGSKVDGKTVLGDTWRWSNGGWTQLHPAQSPPPRVFGAMAFDPATTQMVLYGGGGANTGDAFHADTWTWDGSTWTQQHPAASPPPGAVTLGYDDVSSRLLLLIGPRTWTWDGRTWLPLPGVAPLRNTGEGSLMVDIPGGSPFLFDMDATTTQAGLGVYRWRAGTWVDATPSGAGPRCIGGATSDRGGLTITVVGCDDSQWRYSVPGTSPPHWRTLARPPIGSRRWINMVAAPDGVASLLFGGISNGTTGLLHNDLWSWDGTRWTRLTNDAPTCPPGASCH